MNIVATLLSLVIISSFPAIAAADFYRYYDENGGVNVTNDYTSIPERYRTSVTVTTDRQLEKKARARDRGDSGRAVQAQRPQQMPGQPVPAQSATRESPPASTAQNEISPSATTGNTGWLSRQIPMLKVMSVIVLLIAGFVAVGRVVSSLAPRSLAVFIKVAMIAAIGVFLTRGFSEKIADAFARIKEESEVAQKAVEKRSEKFQLLAE